MWANNYGWLDPLEGLWYAILPPSEFIADIEYGPYKYYYDRGKPILETLDQYLWFTSGAGIVRLDLETNQWCMLSTLPFVNGITKDSAHNIWVVDENNIYKYPQTP